MKKVSLAFLYICSGGLILNHPTVAKFIEQFEQQPMYSIKSVPWDVSFDVLHDEESIHEQVVTNFKPGDKKENIIKLINDNEYATVFHVTITCEGTLFENSKISLSLNELEKASVHKLEKSRQNEVNDCVQSYEIEVAPHSEMWLATHLEWTLNDEFASQYEGTSGKIIYSAISEAIFND